MRPARSNSSPARCVQVTMSFDVPTHRHLPIEIYGSRARSLVPDPNRFGGEIEIRQPAKDKWLTLKTDILCHRRRLPLDRPRRHGARDPREPAAPRERRAGAACAGGDGGVQIAPRQATTTIPIATRAGAAGADVESLCGASYAA